jgi:homoserine O-acetyltransferase/O-succinyltransferase
MNHGKGTKFGLRNNLEIKVMKRNILIISFLFGGTLLSQPINSQSQLQKANLGDVVLENGTVLNNCQLAYRTFGTLNNDRSNAVLFPAWLGGTSEMLAGFIGKEKFVDDTKYFVIAVDPLGNGVSTSPSNYSGLAEREFPIYTIGDMVKTEYLLLTKVLGIQQLYGVIGMSMGGHEVFEWIVSYPSFVKKAVSIVGTPRMTGYEQLYWQTQLEIFKAFQNCDSCDAGRFLSLWLSLFAYSSEYQNTIIQPGGINQFMDQISRVDLNINDYCSQIRALQSHDVIPKGSGSFSQTASLVKAELMIIAEMKDLICNPNSAIEFAGLVGGKINKLSNPCGHISFVCETGLYSDLVRRFFSD